MPQNPAPIRPRVTDQRIAARGRYLLAYQMAWSGLTLKVIGRVLGGVGVERARQLVAKGCRLMRTGRV